MDQDPFADATRDSGNAHGYGPEAEDDRPLSERSTAPEWSPPRPDSGGLRGLLEHQVRERPLPTLLLGVLAGWVAGKLLR